MPLFDLIAFDADDTLWHNERLYVEVQAAFARLLAQYQTPDLIHEHLYRIPSCVFVSFVDHAYEKVSG